MRSPVGLTHDEWVVKLRNWRDGWFISSWKIKAFTFLSFNMDVGGQWSRHRSLVAGWQVSWPVDLAQVVSYGVIDPISAIHRDCTRSQKFDHRNSRQVRPPDDGCSVRIPCWVHLRVYDISMICISLDWLSFCVDMIDMTIRIYSCKCSTSHTDSIYLVYIYIYIYICIYICIFYCAWNGIFLCIKDIEDVSCGQSVGTVLNLHGDDLLWRAQQCFARTGHHRTISTIDLAFLKWGTPNHPSHGWSDDHFSIETHAFADLGEFLGYLHFRKPPFGGFPVHLRHSWANMSLWSLHEAWTFLHSVTESQASHRRSMSNEGSLRKSSDWSWHALMVWGTSAL